MKLRRQARLKAAVTGAAGGLLLLFLHLVSRNPVPANSAPDVAVSPTPDYNRLFAPSSSGTPPVLPAAEGQQPHTRSRAS